MTIHLIGDSTVAPGPLDGTGVIGWGGVLHEFAAEPVTNHAIGGATTASFLLEGRWARAKDSMRAGDLVVIQFGHNDQKEATLAADGGYRRNLEGFVTETRALQAEPVLVTSVERRLWGDDGALLVSHGPYPRAVRRLARHLAVPLIDLLAFTRWLYVHLGVEGSRSLFPQGQPGFSPEEPEDNTHYALTGARVVAAYVNEHLRAVRGLDDDSEALGKWFVRP